MPAYRKMICAYPRRGTHGKEYPCGKCFNCRINQRRRWTLRLLLEAMQYPGRGQFITLTYAESPVTPTGRSTLDPDGITKWLKRLRKYAEQRCSARVRYFLVGEYGGRFGRAHYHLILFGLTLAQADAAIAATWKLGRTQVDDLWSLGTVEIKMLQYVCGYVLKKYAKKDEDIGDAVPEFTRSSRRPGIGVAGLQRLKKLYVHNRHLTYEQTGDIEPTLMVFGKNWPLDRFLREKLRLELGIPTLAEDRPLRVYELPDEEQLEKARFFEEQMRLKHKFYVQKEKKSF